MKTLLVVIDHKQGVNVLLQKAMALTPTFLHVLVFEENNTDIVQVLTQQVESTLDAMSSMRCKAKVTTDVVNTDKEKAVSVIELAQSISADSVVIRRTKMMDESHVFELEKSLLKGLKHSSVLLLGDKNWKSPLNVLGTLDMTDDSAQQSQLNNLVYDKALAIAAKLDAQLHWMSVIAISKVSTELDIVESSDVLAKKGGAIKAKLSDYVNTKTPDHHFLTHVTAGVPYQEIPALAKKVNADLVVLGNVGRTGLKGLIIGNTAEKILQRLSVDALLVKQ